MLRKEKLMNVGSWWPPSEVERLDKAREGTYLTRSVFIRKAVLEHLDEKEQMMRAKDDENEK